MKAEQWNTYIAHAHVDSYDPPMQGVHSHQVRHGPSGWLTRIKQGRIVYNKMHISADEGVAWYKIVLALAEAAAREGWVNALRCGEYLASEAEHDILTSVAARVHYGILCAKQVYHEERWVQWADGWLSGMDRSKNAAIRALTATFATYAANPAQYAALYAAYAALYANADAYASHTADVAYAAQYAAYAYPDRAIDFAVLAAQAVEAERTLSLQVK